MLLITQLRRGDDDVAGGVRAGVRGAARLHARIAGAGAAGGRGRRRRTRWRRSRSGDVTLAARVLPDGAVDLPARATSSRRLRAALDHIVAGDIFQVQVSRRFSRARSRAHPFTLYTRAPPVEPDARTCST